MKRNNEIVQMFEKEYDALEEDAFGRKIAKDVEDGVEGEVYENEGVEIVKYIKCFKNKWFER